MLKKIVVFLFFVINSKSDTITLIGVGDIMLGTYFPNKSYLPNKNILTNISDITKNADISFANIEGVIANEKATLTKKCKDKSKCYAFKMPPEYAEYIHKAGFDMVSLANNHSGDFGDEGRKQTINNLNKYSIKTSGLLIKKMDSITVRDNKTCIISFSPNIGTLYINDYKNASKKIKYLDSICNVTIVSFHGGAEGSKYQNVKNKTEYFYNENRGNLIKFSHMAIENGADIVFGHGPHVTRAIEIYKNKFISYSLGNFATYARFNITGVKGIAPIIKLWVNEKGNFIKGKIFSIKQIKKGIPILDSLNLAFKKIVELTNTDFPNNKIEFNEKDNTFK